MNKGQLKAISLTVGCWGLLFLGSGLYMNAQNTTILEKDYSLDITQMKVSESKTNEIILKDMELEINNPLSVDIKDYIESIDKIENSVLKSLKLDTSTVNVQEAGKYTYTVTYKKKKFKGNFVIKEKELPKVTLTLRNLTLKKDSVLDSKLSTYIKETLDPEVEANITLDLSSVNTKIEGTYQYTVTYDNRIYTANIEIYTPTPTIKTPNTTDDKDTPTVEEKDKDKTEE